MSEIDLSSTIAARVREYAVAVVKWLEFFGGLVVVIVLGIAITILVYRRKNGKGT